jgi:uncharacterized hydrophobic protein (TIGR00341 family)
MPQRLLKTVIPSDMLSHMEAVLSAHPTQAKWFDSLDDGRVEVGILVDAGESEHLMDLIQRHFAKLEGFRVLVLPVEASVPRESQVAGSLAAVDDVSTLGADTRISRQELYEDLSQSAGFSRTYIAMMTLSTVVAAIGLMRGNVAVVIGAMVIAPLLGPNMSLALATTLADVKLARRALTTNALGTGLALGVAILFGLLGEVDPQVGEISSRTQVNLGDIALAMASGFAGALAFTTGLSTTVVGVMVSVALLPPLATFGMLLGSNRPKLALGALGLFLVNVICVNLSGVVTFLFQGIRPTTWWDESRARKATWLAIAIWALLLAALATVICLTQKRLG